MIVVVVVAYRYRLQHTMCNGGVNPHLSGSISIKRGSLSGMESNISCVEAWILFLKQS